MAGVGLIRLRKELKMLADEPPPGVCAWPVDDCITHLQAQIEGPEDSPYERGTFVLDLQIPERYPFEPPKVRFVTPIYHPNIDSGGRICLDTLKMRPAGSWAPSMNVPTLLTTIRLLMAHPNGDDGLMPDITELFLKNPSRFADVARAHVEQHARQNTARPAAVTASKGGAKATGGTLEAPERANTTRGGQTVPGAHQDGSNATIKACPTEGEIEDIMPGSKANGGKSPGARRAGSESSAGKPGAAASKAEERSPGNDPDATTIHAAGARKDGSEGEMSKSASGQEEAGVASSNDGEWSDDDNDNDSEGSDRPTPKRARPAAP